MEIKISLEWCTQTITITIVVIALLVQTILKLGQEKNHEKTAKLFATRRAFSC